MRVRQLDCARSEWCVKTNIKLIQTKWKKYNKQKRISCKIDKNQDIKIQNSHHRGSVQLMLPFKGGSSVAPAKVCVLCDTLPKAQIHTQCCFNAVFFTGGAWNAPRQVPMCLVEISAQPEPWLPAGFSCPAGRPPQPGRTWRRLSPRSCWRPWWRCWCALPWGCNTLRSRWAPSDRSTSRNRSWSPPETHTNTQNRCGRYLWTASEKKALWKSIKQLSVNYHLMWPRSRATQKRFPSDIQFYAVIDLTTQQQLK